MKSLFFNNLMALIQTGIVTRRPLVLQLHRLDEGREYAEFGHLPRRKFTDFGKFLYCWCSNVDVTMIWDLCSNFSLIVPTHWFFTRYWNHPTNKEKILMDLYKFPLHLFDTSYVIVLGILLLESLMPWHYLFLLYLSYHAQLLSERRLLMKLTERLGVLLSKFPLFQYILAFIRQMVRQI